ncbi:TetR/AcrR family transcriptional regulator [uncultured Clostridium sp.]|uniref:TetR/AcrR family transcriptional regulator n=1 Tax=uncultured Clostridium sp. TaxID=59620 RepID=UPI0025FC1215|nr:TetR/AcrR family transcriptional regulator [uncultured Clostridium sp.]
MNNEKRAKDYITEGLFQLMERKDYKDITITDITKRAGVNRVTFYRNFNSKEDVIKIYLEKSFKEWGKQWEESGDSNIQHQIFRYFDEQRRVIALLYKSGLQHFLAENILIACGYKKEEENVIAYTKSLFAYAIFGWCNEWYLRGMQESQEEMAKALEEFDKENKKSN